MDLTSQTQKELDNSLEVKNLKKLEAALFISAKYLGIMPLVELTDINPLLLKELIVKLQKEYGARDSALEIIERQGKYKMDVKEEYRKMINKIATGSAEFSRAEQETLAIVAYKQPVKQSVIVKIRGNKAYDHIKHLIENGLLKAKKIGHTKELNLSEDFYNYFSLEKKTKELEKKEVVQKKEVQENVKDNQEG
tara:strand:- start:33 stop:614 length:582 start_codon:yes stop_codon:yes gene_type:complete